jgi:hypothetical protein
MANEKWQMENAQVFAGNGKSQWHYEYLSLTFIGRFWEVLSRERTRIANSLPAWVSKNIATSTLRSIPHNGTGFG